MLTFLYSSTAILSFYVCAHYFCTASNPNILKLLKIALLLHENLLGRPKIVNNFIAQNSSLYLHCTNASNLVRSFVCLLACSLVLSLNNDLFSSLNLIYIEFMFVLHKIKWKTILPYRSNRTNSHTHTIKWFICPVCPSNIRTTHLIHSTQCRTGLSISTFTQLYYTRFKFKR